MNVKKAFNERMEKVPYIAWRYGHDAEYHARVYQFIKALEVVHLSLIADEVTAADDIMNILIDGWFNECN